MASSARCSNRSSCVSAGTPSAPHSQWGHLCPLCRREPPQLHTASGATCVRCVGGNPLSSTQPVGPLVSAVSAGTPSAPHSQWGHLCPLCQREPPQLHTASGATCVRCVSGNPLSSTQPVQCKWGHLCPLCRLEPPQLHTASGATCVCCVSGNLLPPPPTPSAPHNQWGHLCPLCQREPPPPQPPQLHTASGASCVRCIRGTPPPPPPPTPSAPHNQWGQLCPLSRGPVLIIQMRVSRWAAKSDLG